MSRSLTVALTAAAVAAAAVLFSAPAHAAPSGSLTVFGTRTEWQQIDLPPSGDTAGDMTVGTANVARTRGGPVIGSIAFNSVTIRVAIPGGSQSRMSTQWLTLPGGAIQSSSLIEAPQGTPPVKSQDFVIVGGTGRFAGAQGTMTMTPLGANENKYVFRFVR